MDEPVQVAAPLLGHGHVHGQQDGGGRVDGHGRGHRAQVDAGVEVLHVGQGVDRHPALAHLYLLLKGGLVDPPGSRISLLVKRISSEDMSV